MIAWTPDYPAASQDITSILSCQLTNSPDTANAPEFCNRQLQNLMDRAESAQEANSPAASALWAEADRMATNDAPLVPLIIEPTISFVSARVGNYEYSPALGGTVLIDQLWVK